jgi:hypothetical protein
VKEEGALSALRNGHASIADLLMGSQGDAKLREYVLNHLAKFRRTTHYADPALVRWLLQFVEPSQITEKLILNARYLNAEIIGMLLDHNRDLHITEEMIRKCSQSRGAIKAFVTREPEMKISSDILITIMQFWPFDAELCIKLINKTDPAVITCEAIAEAASIAGAFGIEEQVMPVLLLLLKRAEQINFTELAVMQAFQNDSTGKVVKTLLAHKWPVTPSLLRDVTEWGRAATFPLILDAAGGTDQITPELFEAAAGRIEADGKEILELLVSQSRQPINNETWLRMIGNCLQRETLRFILNLKPNTPVPESTLLRLAEDGHFGNNLFVVLLNDERDLEITDAVVGMALANMNYGELVPQLLNRHGTECITEQVLIGAVSNIGFGHEMTRALMDREVPIEAPSADVINAVVQNIHSGLQILRMLEAHFGPFEFTDENVEAAASGSSQVIQLVFGRRSITHTTNSMLLKAASKGNLDGMKTLLQLEDAVVTREILIAAAKNSQCGPELLRWLWDRSPEIKLCVEIFKAAATVRSVAPETMGFLVDRIDDSQFGQQVLEAVTGSDAVSLGDSILMETLLNSSLSVQVTSEMVARVREQHGTDSFLWRVMKRHCQNDEDSDTAET